MGLYMIFQKFEHFQLTDIFVSLSQKFWAKKVIIFCDFLKKIIIFGDIWYQKLILWLISFPKMCTLIYVTVKI